MKKTIKLAAIHCGYNKLPEECNPHSGRFDPCAPVKYLESNFEKNIAFIHEAGRNNVDLVCTTEDFVRASQYVRNLDYPELFDSLVEEIPGPISRKIGEIARQYHMYVAVNYNEKSGSKIYNTSVLIGRDGEIIGKYRKVHVADGERWRVTCGNEIPVFETDIGRIGFAICYDIIFPELSRILALKGANIIIHQTQGWGIGGKAPREAGEAMMRTRAGENSVYLVVAKNIQPGDGGMSCIIDNSSNLLAVACDEEEKLIVAEFIPDFNMEDPYNFDNFFAGVTSTKARQLLAREPKNYSTIIDKMPPVLEHFKGTELVSAPDKAKLIYEKWKNINNTEIKKYHW